MSSMEEEINQPIVVGYYQLKAELQVSIQRIVKESKDEILDRFERAERERKEERRDLDERLRKLEANVPRDLPEQLLRLHDHTSQATARSKLVLWLIPLILTAAGLAVAFMRP